MMDYIKNLDCNQINIFINLEIIGEEKSYLYIYIYLKSKNIKYILLRAICGSPVDRKAQWWGPQGIDCINSKKDH